MVPKLLTIEGMRMPASEFSVSADSRSCVQIAMDIRRLQRRWVGDRLNAYLSLLRERPVEEAPETGFVLLYAAEMAGWERDSAGVFSRARELGLRTVSLASGLRFGEKYPQSELKAPRVIVFTHGNFNLPRASNPSKDRPYRLYLGSAPNGDEIDLMRASRGRNYPFEVSDAFAFSKPKINT